MVLRCPILHNITQVLHNIFYILLHHSPVLLSSYSSASFSKLYDVMLASTTSASKFARSADFTYVQNGNEIEAGGKKMGMERIGSHIENRYLRRGPSLTHTQHTHIRTHTHTHTCTCTCTPDYQHWKTAGQRLREYVRET